MIDLRTKTNIKSEMKNFKREFAKKVLQKMVNGMKKSVREVGIIAAQDFLHGPRPKRLDIWKGRLIRAMKGGLSFGGASRREGIEEVKLIGNKVTGTKGLETFEPFDYPRMWEKTGHGEIKPKKARALRFETESGDIVFTKRVRAVGPKPFLQPALDKAGREGILEDIFKESMKDLRYD